MVHIRMEPKVKRALETLALRDGITLTAFITRAVLREARREGMNVQELEAA